MQAPRYHTQPAGQTACPACGRVLPPYVDREKAEAFCREVMPGGCPGEVCPECQGKGGAHRDVCSQGRD